MNSKSNIIEPDNNIVDRDAINKIFAGTAQKRPTQQKTLDFEYNTTIEITPNNITNTQQNKELVKPNKIKSVNKSSAYRLKYNTNIKTIYKIWIKNILLEIFTFMIYRSWAKTRMRKYLYGSFSINGDSLEYIGSGKELFVSFLKVYIFSFIFFYSLYYAVYYFSSYGTNISFRLAVPYYLFAICLAFFAQFSTVRYRINRISWRGIRGRLKGSGLKYMLYLLKLTIVNILTLSLSKGRNDLKARKYIVDRMYWGNQKCTFKHSMKSLDDINLFTGLLPYIACVILYGITSNILIFSGSLLLMAISRLWYRAALLNAKIDCVKCGPISFKGTHTGESLLELYFINIILLIASLGLLTPIVLNRTMKYHSSHIIILGNLDKLYALSAPTEGKATGEGINDITYLDSNLDFDMSLI